MLGCRLQLEQIHHVDEAELQIRRALAQNRGRGQRLHGDGFSHQDPGFIDLVTNKGPSMLVNCRCFCLSWRIIVCDEAIIHCSKGIGIWARASTDAGEEPDVVLASCGDDDVNVVGRSCDRRDPRPAENGAAIEQPLPPALAHDRAPFPQGLDRAVTPIGNACHHTSAVARITRTGPCE
jgi:XFP C-terminal domain